MSGRRGIAAAQPVGGGRNDLMKVRVINQMISQSVKGRVCTRDELINAASETIYQLPPDDLSVSELHKVWGYNSVV